MTDSGLKNQFLKQLEEHSDILHKIGNVYSTSKEDKEDLIQEMVYQLWRSFKNFRKESKFSTWMYRVSLNTALMEKRKCHINIDENEISGKELKHITSENQNEEIQILYRAINTLNCSDKAITLLYLEEKSYKEISEITGLTVKNVSVKIVRIKSKLKKLLSGYLNVE